jgi:hypothetical protein
MNDVTPLTHTEAREITEGDRSGCSWGDSPRVSLVIE